jgi:uncharacterized protein (TIGR00255 family)
MTGFGAAEGTVAGGRLRVEIRTVNHRFFNLAPKLPNELASLEGDVRERLRQEFDRGHIAVHARWVEAPGSANAAVSGPTINLPRAQAVVAQLRELQQALGLGGDVTVELVARQPEVLVAPPDAAPDVAFAQVEPILADAARECTTMRRREGAALGAELGARLDLLEVAAAVIALRAPERLVRERERLRASVAALLDGAQLDEARVAQELAHAADRLDITEELVRFRAHVGACRDALASDRAVGKQLGFLAQELGREVNTMGAKANDAEIAQQVIAMKGELEKFREQLENLE